MVVARAKPVKFFLALAVAVHVATWLYARDIQAQWANVPPVPGRLGAGAFALGDSQLAYRIIGVMLQNLGNTGGRSTALDQYDYEELGKWFFLTHELDARSNYTPFLAAFYFGAVQDPSKLLPVTEYLAEMGQRPGLKQWRWLAQAVYLARYQMKDLDRALQYAHMLAALKDETMPTWTRQMPAFVMHAQGNKEEAIGLLLEILNSGAGHIHPNEANHTREYICTRILDAEEAKGHPLCQDLPDR